MIEETTLKRGINAVELPAESMVVETFSTFTGRPAVAVAGNKESERIHVRMAVIRNGEDPPPPASPLLAWQFLGTLRPRLFGLFPLPRLVLLRERRSVSIEQEAELEKRATEGTRKKVVVKKKTAAKKKAGAKRNPKRNAEA